MKKILNLFGTLLTITSLGFLATTLYKHISSIPPFGWTMDGALSIICGVAYFHLAFFFITKAWLCLLENIGVYMPFSQGYAIMGRSQIAKYLPGNVFHYAGRIALASKYSVSTEATTLTTGLEAGLILIAAALIILVGLSVGNISLVRPFLPMSNLSGIMYGAIAVLLVLLAVSVMLSKSLRSWFVARRSYLQTKGIICALFLYLIYFAPVGFVIHFILQSLWPLNTLPSWIEFASGFSFAWVLGFVVPGASGGIGIREAVFVALFGGQIGQGLAVGGAILLRIITSIADVATFLLASWLSRKYPVS
ncbi:MAG: hypothetical protein HY277_01675 [Ignavibacteriales bacterium]|nr:hypothetical protein [Ignavibacteriales bacterium]